MPWAYSAVGWRPNSPPQITIVLSSRPRRFRSFSSPAIGLSVSPACLPWFFTMSLCASQFASLWFPPLYTWMNRTPRSTIRRASRHFFPKSSVRVPSMPYNSFVSAVSVLKSTASGACCCILNASS